MGFLRESLGKVADIEQRYALPLFAVVAVITLVMALGLPRLTLQTDFNKEMPQHLPIVELNNRITDKFSGQDTMIILVTIDKNSSENSQIKDIREPAVLNYMSELETSLKKESQIVAVMSPSTYLPVSMLTSLEMSKQAIAASPANSLISRDYETALMMVSADTGSSDAKIIELDNLIKQKIKTVQAPQGIKVMVTGNPQIRVTLFELLGQDALNTILYASVIILILLFITEFSIVKGLLVFAPLGIGLIWTYGTLGWLGIKISIATAGLGAIILGLGVEYGVFIITRYNEERSKGKEHADALSTTVKSIGSAVIGSGGTMIVGFLALTLSIIPMMQNLGFSLALGIFFALAASIFVLPILITLTEHAGKENEKRNHRKALATIEKYKGDKI